MYLYCQYTLIRIYCLLIVKSSKIINGFNVDSATSQNRHSKTVQHTKSTEISSPDRTKSDEAQATLHGSCPEDNKQAVITSKATAESAFKLTISGQVISLI